MGSAISWGWTLNCKGVKTLAESKDTFILFLLLTLLWCYQAKLCSPKLPLVKILFYFPLCINACDFVLVNINVGTHKGQKRVHLGPTGAGVQVVVNCIL